MGIPISLPNLTPVEDWIFRQTGYVIRGDRKFIQLAKDFISGETTEAEMLLNSMLTAVYQQSDARLIPDSVFDQYQKAVKDQLGNL